MGFFLYLCRSKFCVRTCKRVMRACDVKPKKTESQLLCTLASLFNSLLVNKLTDSLLTIPLSRNRNASADSLQKNCVRKNVTLSKKQV